MEDANNNESDSIALESSICLAVLTHKRAIAAQLADDAQLDMENIMVVRQTFL